MNRICAPCGEIGRRDYYIFDENQCTPAINCLKIIYNTSQCFNECLTVYFLLGSYYYQSCSGNVQQKAETNECECINTYYTTENNGKKQFHCLSDSVICNLEHKYYYSKQSNTTSTSPTYFLKVEYRPGLSNIIKYLDSCDTSFL